MTGPWILVAALATTLVVALALRAWNGRFRATAAPAAPAADEAAPGDTALRVRAEEIGADLGERLTFVQFSSAFCSPCRATRTLLADVVKDRDGVAHVEVDAESHLELVRRLDVLRTPTVLLVDPAGVVLSRASGLPRREQVEAVVDAVLTTRPAP